MDGSPQDPRDQLVGPALVRMGAGPGRAATRGPMVCEVCEQRAGAGVARSLRRVEAGPARPLTHSHSSCHRFPAP